jgi:hypothetical protein
VGGTEGTTRTACSDPIAAPPWGAVECGAGADDVDRDVGPVRDDRDVGCGGAGVADPVWSSPPWTIR